MPLLKKTGQLLTRTGRLLERTGQRLERKGPLPARAKLVLAAASAACLLFLVYLMLSEPMKQDKATWLWDASIISAQTEDILAFSRKEGVTAIFLQIQAEVPEEDYRRFIRSARESGIAVHALDGQPEWAYREKRKEGERLLSWIEEFNQQARPGERFEGVQFDVEPYVLKRWDNEREEVIREWKGNVEIWTGEARRQGLSFSAAVPFWLDSIPLPGETGNFGRWMQETTDAVAVMSYRNDGEQMYELAREELELGDRLGTSVWIGMELTDTDEGEHLTFHGKSEKAVKKEARRAATLGTGHPSFAGLAVHHYQAWHRKMAMSAKHTGL